MCVCACVCVCVCVCGGGELEGGVGACVRACVCTLLLLSIFLVFERFLAPCLICVVDVLLLNLLNIFM